MQEEVKRFEDGYPNEKSKLSFLMNASYPKFLVNVLHLWVISKKQKWLYCQAIYYNYSVLDEKEKQIKNKSENLIDQQKEAKIPTLHVYSFTNQCVSNLLLTCKTLHKWTRKKSNNTD